MFARLFRSVWINWVRFVVTSIVVFAAETASAQSPDLPIALAGSSEPETRCSDDFFGVIGRSVFDKQPDPKRKWSPLTLGDFADGWLDSWIAPPDPSGGSLRQGWANTYDAFFNRMIVGIYSYANAARPNRNEQSGTLIWETPITRRYMFGIIVPFIDSLQGGSTPQATGFGNVTVENRFILEETQDLTLSFNLNARIPTGDPALGDNRTSLNPYLSFFKDIGNGFSIRGTGGIDVPVDSRPDGINSTLIGQVGIGQTLTSHDVPLLGDFTYYVTANFRQSFGVETTSLTLTPGFRTHLGHNYWFLGGVEVPLTGPRPFEERFTFILVKGY